MAGGTTVRMWRRAMFVLTMLVVVGFSVIVFRLAQLQLVQGEALQQRAVDQQLKDTKINAQRGTIYDCNMKPLAQSATVWTVVLEPAYLTDDSTREKIARGLSEILGMEYDEVLAKAKKRSYYTIIKRKVESHVKDKIAAFQKENGIKAGIRMIEDYKRYYPYGDFASAVLGFVGTDSQGLAGIENYYNKYLTGEAGRLVTLRNAIGTDMPFEYEQLIAAKNGYHVVLCIDEVIQHFLEKNLEEGIINNKVRNRAVAIVMDVNDGAILGMAVKDGYDLNKPFDITDKALKEQIDVMPEADRQKAKGEALEKQWRNKAVSDTYMPGSVFKMVTTAMGFEESLIDENTKFSCTGSMVPVKGAKPVKCWRSGGHGIQTFLQGLCNSCNPVFIQLGQKVGAEKFYSYYNAFGFTEKTGIDLPGEANGIFFSKDGSMAPMDLVVASFGQNFSITPIQMITAAAAIANGGHLVQPHMVRQIVDNEGNIIKSVDRVAKRQVISEGTSKRLCEMLHTNATIGTAKNGYVPGFRVAGKTGTSQKIGSSGAGGMDYIASYCGFAPADSPKYALLIFYDTPKGESYYGGAIAGPTFGRVMQDVLPYLGVERRYTDEELQKLDIPTPFLVGSTIGEAKSKAEQLQLCPVVRGSGSTVIAQIPEVSSKMCRGGTIILYTDKESMQKTVKVPNLIGLTLSNANKATLAAGLNINIKGTQLRGSEVVSVSQDVPEGSMVSPGTVVTVTFAQRQSTR